MKIDKKKLKKHGKEILWAAKESVTMTAPIYPAAILHHTGNPEAGAIVGTATLPWVAGYSAYHYVKGRKLKKKKDARK